MSTAARLDSLAAIVLAGGRGSRLGGVDKAAVELHGEPLADRTIAAALAAGAEPVVLVGPTRGTVAGVVAVREDPPFSGPLAALSAGLAAVDREWVLLLSCDLVHPHGVLRALLDRPAPGLDCDGVLLEDPDGHRQWLAGLYRTDALRRGVAAIGAPLAGLPLRRVFDGARLTVIRASSDLTADIDTPADLERAGRPRISRKDPP